MSKNDKFKELETIKDELPDHEKSHVSADDHSTTGHEWDGIREFDKPIPRWWLWSYYLSIVFSIGYMIAYPAIPLVNDYTKGLLGWSSRDAVDQSIKDGKAAQQKYIDAMASASLSEIQANDELMGFAKDGGKSAYQVNCIQCHATGAVGAEGYGYPNLNDDDWLWGGNLDEIYTTIKHGVRFNEDEDTRFSQMPAFVTDEILTNEEVTNVAHYVRSLSSLDHDAKLATMGTELFADNCASCHGDDGKGDREQGAPNLADAVWLYGSDLQTVKDSIAFSRQGVMPAWGHRLDDVTIKQLTLYIHSRGGGE